MAKQWLQQCTESRRMDGGDWHHLHSLANLKDQAATNRSKSALDSVAHPRLDSLAYSLASFKLFGAIPH